MALSTIGWVCVVALCVTSAVTAKDDENSNNVLQLLSSYEDIANVDVEKMMGDAPELKITVTLRRENCFDPVVTTCEENPIRDCSCFEATNNATEPFVATIQPQLDGSKFSALCMPVDADGHMQLWTTLMFRRVQPDDSDNANFNRKLHQYRIPFGKLSPPMSEDFWMGLDRMHELTNSAPAYMMRLDFEPMQGVGHYLSKSGQKVHGVFNTFRIAGPREFFKMTVQNVSEFADTGLEFERDYDGQYFSTADADYTGPHDRCPARHRAGWWFKPTRAERCGKCVPTGPIENKSDERVFGCDRHGEFEHARQISMAVYPRD